MKRACFLLLLLCLLLTACTTAPELGTEAPVVLPTLNRPTLEDPTASTAEETPEALPELNGTLRSITGPAGKVYALSYRSSKAKDPVYGDVDGDGQTELVYRSAATNEGTVYEALWVYGLEAGWPVFKGYGLFRIGNGATDLTAEDGQVYYSYTNRALGQETVLLPLVLEDGLLRLDAETLPEGLSQEMDHTGNVFCTSFRETRERLGDRLLASDPAWLIWEEPGCFYTEEEASEGYRYRFVGVTDNGVTVTAVVYWEFAPNGSRSCFISSPWNNPPRQVKDPEALLGLTEQALTDKLSHPHYEALRNDRYAVLCWFTEDEKLLTVQIEDTVVSAVLTDLPLELGGSEEGA